jgi:hypothetical protein
LTLKQLDELLVLRPSLINTPQFIETYISRLGPNADVDLSKDAQAKLEYFGRLGVFISKLAPAFNGHRVGLLFNQLLHGLKTNHYDEDLFMEYIRIPKWSSSVNNDFAKLSDSSCVPQLYYVPNIPHLEGVSEAAEESLVTEYLFHFFSKTDAVEPSYFTTYLRESFLTPIHAKAKLLYTDKDLDKFTAFLGTSTAQTLRESIEITLLQYNKQIYLPSDSVQIDVELKNVPTLIVKVFEINTERYFKDNLKQLPDDIQLDGLVANEEKLFKYTQPPVRRHRERFDFPALSQRRGFFVIEFIGNGKSSRAIVRKGSLGLMESFDASGHVFTVFDEKRQLVKTASLWLNGHQFSADEDGEISVPFTRSPGQAQCVIMSPDGFADLGIFYHRSESYTLDARFYCDRENLIATKKATVLVRASLRSEVPVSLSLLKDLVFTVDTTDIDGISASKEFKNVQLNDDQDASFEFQVPDKLQRVQFSLRGTVKNLSSGSNDALSASNEVTLNAIDATAEFRSAFLRPRRNGYEIAVLGKSGEPVADRIYTVVFKHRFFSEEKTFARQTDQHGIIRLPPLPDFDSVGLRENHQSFTWRLNGDSVSLPSVVTAIEGDTISIPYATSIAGPGEDPAVLSKRSLAPGEVALFQTDCMADLSAKVSLVNGILRISGISRGNYGLVLRKHQVNISLVVTKGVKHDAGLLGDTRQLQPSRAPALQISDIELPTDKTSLKIQLKNWSASTRVHVFVTEFWPEYQLMGLHEQLPKLFVSDIASSYSSYLNGRTLGDEYRYILDRRYAKVYPGNTLQRPSLLLQPRVTQSTSTAHESLDAASNFRSMAPACAKAANLRAYGDDLRQARLRAAASPNIDFKPQVSLVRLNLKPNADGEVTIPASELSGGLARVFAVDDAVEVIRHITLETRSPAYKDMRLKKVRALDADHHFTEQISISERQPGESFVCPDITTSKIEVFDSLGKAWSLLSSLSGHSTLTEFGFVLGWSTLSDAEKQDKYSKYACHELNTFVFFKDRPFFDRVIKPYIGNKKEQTFIDHWLLGHDLRAWLSPGEFQKLNAFEKAVLASAIGAEGDSVVRYLADVSDASRSDPAEFNRRFNAALKGSSLETASNFDMQEAAEQIMTRKTLFAGAARDASLPSAAPSDDLEALMMSLDEGGYADEDQDMDYAEKEAKEEEYEEDAYVEKRKQAPHRVRAKERRAEPHEFYREIDQTKEYAETNYWGRGKSEQTFNLVPIHQFWADFAARNPKTPFLSKNFIWATSSFTEVMFALSVLDLPLRATASLNTEYNEAQMTIKAEAGLIIFHKDIKEAAVETRSVLATQTFFDPQDRYSYDRGEQTEKYIQDEFLRNKVYGCHIILTNVGPSRQRASVLLQIPVGSIPVQRGTVTKSQFVDLGPYQSTQLEYYFYWPAAGAFPHFPAHAARDERVIAFAQPVVLNVVESLSKIDKTNWDWTSQMGTDDEVLSYVQKENIHNVDIDKIAWRMRDQKFFEKAMPVLASRHRVTQTLLGYAFMHSNVPLSQQYLLWNSDRIASTVGYNMPNKLVDTDATRLFYIEHLEYSPIVNARAHQIGAKRTILNDRFKAQYEQFTSLLCLKPGPLSNEDLMSACYYMLLQDRIDEAKSLFERIPAEQFKHKPKSESNTVNHLQLQYDYLATYLDFFNDAPTRAREIASAYVDYPVPRWRKMFADVRQQLDEVDGVVSVEAEVSATDTTQQRNVKLAAKTASLDFSVVGNTVALNYQATNKCTVKIFKMDIELLFSNSPFVQQELGNFAYIVPNAQFDVQLPEGSTDHSFELPAEFHNANVMILVSSGAVSCVKPHYSHSLHVNVIENFGQLKVHSKTTGKPLSRVYVKVYARHKSGEIKFFKDGYTDIRGGFDYISLNTPDADTTEKLSILIMSEGNGTRIVEARPPQK